MFENEIQKPQVTSPGDFVYNFFAWHLTGRSARYVEQERLKRLINEREEIYAQKLQQYGVDQNTWKQSLSTSRVSDDTKLWYYFANPITKYLGEYSQQINLPVRWASMLDEIDPQVLYAALLNGLMRAEYMYALELARTDLPKFVKELSAMLEDIEQDRIDITDEHINAYFQSVKGYASLLSEFMQEHTNNPEAHALKFMREREAELSSSAKPIEGTFLIDPNSIPPFYLLDKRINDDEIGNKIKRRIDVGKTKKNVIYDHYGKFNDFCNMWHEAAQLQRGLG